MTEAMYAALSETLTRAASDDAIRVVLLRGQHDLFSAGNDIEDFLVQRRDDASEALHFLHLIADFGKPLVAAVGGDAIGIGTTLLLHCDLVYAARNARFQLPFVPLGLCPEGASSLLLPRLLGHRRAAELLFFGAPFDAMLAREMGLVNEVFDAEQLLDAVMTRAQKLASLPAASLAVTKMLLKHGNKASVADTLILEAHHFRRLVAGPIAQGILAAFLARHAEKSLPNPESIAAQDDF